MVPLVTLQGARLLSTSSDTHLHCECVGRVLYPQSLQDRAGVGTVRYAMHSLHRLAEGHGVVVKWELSFKGGQGVNLGCMQQGGTRWASATM